MPLEYCPRLSECRVSSADCIRNYHDCLYHHFKSFLDSCVAEDRGRFHRTNQQGLQDKSSHNLDLSLPTDAEIKQKPYQKND